MGLSDNFLPLLLGLPPLQFSFLLPRIIQKIYLPPQNVRPNVLRSLPSYTQTTLHFFFLPFSFLLASSNKKFLLASTDRSTERSEISANPNDDIQREVSFYTQTLQNTEKALTLLSAEGLDKPRPNDFLAEMYKSDKVMQKVRSRLVKQQVKIHNFEEKKMRVQNKKFNKQVINPKIILTLMFFTLDDSEEGAREA